MHIHTKLSSFKNRYYCNVNRIVYVTTRISTQSFENNIDVKCNVLSKTTDLKAYKDDNFIKVYSEKIEHFLDSGAIVYLATKGNEVVGHYLACRLQKFRPYLYLNKSNIFKPQDDNFYIYYCRTSENYRGQGIYPYVLTFILKNLDTTENKIFISTDVENRASQKGIEKAGFHELGVLQYKAFWRLIFSSSFVLKKVRE